MLTKTTKLLAAVELGNPDADCAHFGICSIKMLPLRQWIRYKPAHVRQVKAVLSAHGNDQLRLEFPLGAMQADTRSQFFPPEGFRVESAAELPPMIARLLQIPTGMAARPGIYTLVQSAHCLTINLTLTPKYCVK